MKMIRHENEAMRSDAVALGGFDNDLLENAPANLERYSEPFFVVGPRGETVRINILGDKFASWHGDGWSKNRPSGRMHLRSQRVVARSEVRPAAWRKVDGHLHRHLHLSCFARCALW